MKKKLKNITESELQSKGVSALADRPNKVSAYGVGQLTAKDLKEWFDKIGRMLADKLNELQTALYNEGENYIAVDGLGEAITSLRDLAETIITGRFSSIATARYTESGGGAEELKPLQDIIRDLSYRLVANLSALYNFQQKLLEGNGDKIGIGSNKTLSDMVNEISNGIFSEYLKLNTYWFDVPSDFNCSLKDFANTISAAFRGESNSKLLSMIEDCYTKEEIDNHENIQAEKINDIKANIGNLSYIATIADNITEAIASLNEDIDSLQLGVVPRITRGIVYVSDPQILNDELILLLNEEVEKATGRTNPNNTDSVQVIDNAMPDAGRVYTYHYWSSEVIGSEFDGWYLASIYTAPSITEIPSYVQNVLLTSWSEAEADANGLRYIVVTPDMHGMGHDATLYVELRRLEDDSYIDCSQFEIKGDGTVICYTDEPFSGKLIIRVGKAYYTTVDTNIVNIEMEQVNGLSESLKEKASVTDLETKIDTVNTELTNSINRLGELAYKSKIDSIDFETNAKCPVANKAIYANDVSKGTLEERLLSLENLITVNNSLIKECYVPVKAYINFNTSWNYYSLDTAVVSDIGENTVTLRDCLNEQSYLIVTIYRYNNGYARTHQLRIAADDCESVPDKDNYYYKYESPSQGAPKQIRLYRGGTLQTAADTVSVYAYAKLKLFC